MEKSINYLARDFGDIKNELIAFSNKYYPEIADSFNDSSIGSWFIDLVSDVGDMLSYHTDRMYQETNINSARLRSTMMNFARSSGLKVPGAKASICEVEMSVELPVSSENIALPDWRYAPIVRRSSTVAAGSVIFELSEDVNFAEQFNSNAYSNRKIVPQRDSNGNITGYNVSKSTIVNNGTSKIYRRVLMQNDLKPFMEIVLPELNVMNVESIIFKETSNYANNPNISDYYIDEEEYRVSADSIKTYRFFECDSLADQYRFGTQTDMDGNGVIADMYRPEVYDDYTEFSPIDQSTKRTTRYYRGKWKPLRQKFITEYTDNGYMKIIFGSGINYDEYPSGQTAYGDYISSKLINNDMLGVLPKAGWTMFILYKVGGGVSTNLAPGAINTIATANIDFGRVSGLDGAIKGQVVNSLSVTNLSTALAGKDAPSTEEIKNLIKYNTGSQNRCVTLNDYRAKVMQMPPKFGAPFRAVVIEANNKIEMSFLGLDASKNLDPSLPQTLVENTVEWMTNYKNINDYIEIKSGKVYDLGVSVDVFIDKNYVTSDVVANIISTVSDYFDVEKHDMGEDIFVGDLEKEIMLLDGVISLIELRIYNIYNGTHSPSICPLPRYSESTVCNVIPGAPFQLSDTGAVAEALDLQAVDNVLYSDYNSMFEILDENSDIQVRVKLK